MESSSMTRAELFSLVWSEPRERLAKRFSGISPAVITRICEEANIPLPGRGYWAKLEQGKKVDRPSLPQRWPGQDSIVSLGTQTSRYSYPHQTLTDKALIDGERPKPPIFEDEIEPVVQAAVDQLRPIRVVRDLGAPHPEVRKLLASEDRRREKTRNTGYSWNQPRFEGPFFQRQLRIINALFLGVAPFGRGASIREEGKFERGLGTCYTLDASIMIGSSRLHFDLAPEKRTP